MKKDNLIRLKNSDLILDSININLLKHFEMYKSKGHKLFCSYMSVGNKYKNEILVVGREPSTSPTPLIFLLILGALLNREVNIKHRIKPIMILFGVALKK